MSTTVMSPVDLRNMLSAFAREFVHPEAGVYGATIEETSDGFALVAVVSRSATVGLPERWRDVPVRQRIGSGGRTAISV